MTLDDNSLRSKRATSSCIGLITAAIAVLVTLVVLAYSARKHTQSEFARDQQERRRRMFADVKSGRSDVSVSDAALIELLANDPKCVEALTLIHFFAADLSDPHFRRVADLVNVNEMSFYCCGNADNVIAVAKDMKSLRSLSFEGTPVSDQSLESLAEFQSLKGVRFEQVMADETIAWLNGLLPNVKVKAPYPASKEPQY